MPVIKPYQLDGIRYIRYIDHPESISVGPGGEAYTTGTGGQVYRLNLKNNTVEQFASTAPRRMLGQAVDADGNLYCADIGNYYSPNILGKVIRLTPEGTESVYATAPSGKGFLCANYPAFDRQGNLYLSDSGDWSENINGQIYRIPPGGGEARLWFPDPVYTPNAIALDEAEEFLYFVDSYGSGVARIAIMKDGSAGSLEYVAYIPHHVPDGIAFDEEGNLWISCHRPDVIYILNLKTRRLEVFAEDWRGEALRAPTDVAFAGSDREVLLAASLGNLVVHRFDSVGVRGLRLSNPKF
jgi:gluconolactonase